MILNLAAQIMDADLPTMFDRLIAGVISHFKAEHACIHLLQSEALSDPARRAALRRCPLHQARTEDLEELVRAEAAFQIQARVYRGPLSLREARRRDPAVARLAQVLRFNDGVAVPLTYQGDLYGYLNIYSSRRWPDHDLRAFLTLGGILYGAVKREFMLKWLRERDDSVDVLARAVEARDPYTGGHVARVRAISRRMGELADLDAAQIQKLERAALLHDIGKVGVPDAVLGKPGPLDEAERQAMERHAELGRQILSGATDPEVADVIAGVAWHHERPDGRGYPDGLRGNDIPVVARIIAVADVYDALVSDRPYRRGMSLERALAILRDARGTQLDAGLVDLFLQHEVWRAAPPVQEIPSTSRAWCK